MRRKPLLLMALAASLASQSARAEELPLRQIIDAEIRG